MNAEFDCLKCGHAIVTAKRAGTMVKCPGCSKWVHVPTVRPASIWRDGETEFGCHKCAHRIVTGKRPGTMVKCPGCSQWVRIPKRPTGKTSRAAAPTPPRAVEPDLPQAAPGPVERTIQARHQLEDRISAFLELAAAMTDRELEIALARLADRLSEPVSEGSVALKTKGQLLHTYYAMRAEGGKSHSRLLRAKRAIGFGAVGPKLIGELVGFNLIDDFGALSDDAVRERVNSLAP